MSAPLRAATLLLLLALLPLSLIGTPAQAQDGSVPDQPTGLAAGASHDSVELTWDDPGDDSITHYQVLRRDRDVHDVGEFVTIESDTRSAATRYTDDTVEPERRYVYRVVAVNTHGESHWSKFARANTPSAPQPTPEPAPKPSSEALAPSGLTAEAAKGVGVSLRWTAPMEDAGSVTGYEVLRGQGRAELTTLVADTESTDTAYTDETATAAGETYNYQVKALRGEEKSQGSNRAVVQLPILREPTPLLSVSQSGVTMVPSNWSLIPDGLGAGDRFRLLVLTSNKFAPTSSDIADYNTFVQARVAEHGHNDIKPYSAGFKVVGSTAKVDARDNTDTTHTADDKGVPIYWLNGDKAADDYEDFYDGSWDQQRNAWKPGGGSFNLTHSKEVATGSHHDGTEYVFRGVSRALGGNSTVLGYLHNSTASTGPLSSTTFSTTGRTYNFYGVSEVFEVRGNPIIVGAVQPPDEEIIWVATLTVGTDRRETFHGTGYPAGGADSALTPDEFTYNGQAVTVTELQYAGDPDDNVALRFDLDDEDSDWTALTGITAVNLYLDDKGFRIDNPGGRTGRTEIGDHGLDWRHGQKVRVWLTIAQGSDDRPTLSRETMVGEPLGVDLSGIPDTTGLPAAAFGYQWILIDGGAETDISGATGATYRPLREHLDKSFKVKVSFTNGGGTDGGTLTSRASDPVIASAYGEIIYSALLTVGSSEDNNVAFYGYSIWNGGTGTLESAEFSYDGSPTVVEVLAYSENTLYFRTSPRLGPDGYRLRLGDTTFHLDEPIGDPLGYEVSGHGLTWTVGESVELRLIPNFAATGTVTVSGIPQLGERLTANPGADIVDPDGLTSPSYAYRWIANDGAEDSEIAGATGKTYWPPASLIGHRIKVRVRFKDDDSNSESLESDYTAAVARPAVTSVPSDWSLIPISLGPGDQFRMMFVTSTTRDAVPTQIDDYNTWIQAQASAGHADIQAYSSSFRVVGSAAEAYARDNTGTTYTSDDKGVPIFWLGGDKFADDYEDFYDGTWYREALMVNQNGTNVQAPSAVWTGSDHDGTEKLDSSLGVTPGVSRALGSPSPVYGQPNTDTSGYGPLSSPSNTANSSAYPFYGLSGVFQVSQPTTGRPTIDSLVPPDETIIWDATLTVGTDRFSSFHGTGYPAGGAESALTPDTFTYNGETVTVSELKYAGDPDDNLTLRLNLEDGDGDWSALTGITAVNLYLDAKGFRIDNPGGRTRRTYIEGHGLEWTQGQKVRVWLTVAENNPPPNLRPAVVTVGETLYADASEVVDPDGRPDDADLDWQWIVGDGTTETDVPGATGITFTPTEEQVGKYIRVRADITDSSGETTTVTSDPTDPVKVADQDLDIGNDQPRGIWGDGQTIWVVNEGNGDQNKVYAYNYNRSDWSHDAGKDFALDGDNHSPRGVFADGNTMWVADEQGRVHAYTIAGGESYGDPDTSAGGDLNTFDAWMAHEGVGQRTGVWSNGSTMWVVEHVTEQVLAYAIDASGAVDYRIESSDFALAVDYAKPKGMWSDGSAAWVVDERTDHIYAYRLTSDGLGERLPALAIRLEDGNDDPWGVWSDGETMWVTDDADAKVYAYPMPAYPGGGVTDATLDNVTRYEADVTVKIANPGSASRKVSLKYTSASGAEETVDKDTSGTVVTFNLTGLSAHTYYQMSVRIDDGAATTIGAFPTLSDDDVIRVYLKHDLVEPYEADYPWVRETYNEMRRANLLVISGHSRVPVRCYGISDLYQCVVTLLAVSLGSEGPGTYAHELAHVYTLASRYYIEGPEYRSMGWLYVNKLAEGGELPNGNECLIEELYADAIDYVTVEGHTGYFSGCSSTPDPPSTETVQFIESILSHEIPDWFGDAYGTSGLPYDTSELDGYEEMYNLEQVWSDLLTMTLIDKTITVWGFQDAFGGYCDESRTNYSQRNYEPDDEGFIRNPWRAGGCVPQAPPVNPTARDAVEWRPPAYDGGLNIDKYRVEWKNADQDFDSSRQTEVTELANLSFQHADLSPGSSVRVTGHNRNGWGDATTATTQTRVIWSAFLGVGSGTAGMGFVTGTVGTLSPITLTVKDVDYIVKFLLLSAAGQLSLQLDDEIDSDFVLHVGDVPFAKSDAGSASGTDAHTYTWDTSGLTWKSSDQIAVRLVVPNTPASGKPTIDSLVPPDETIIWDATLTVGTDRFSSFHGTGYPAGGAESALTPDTFTYNGETVTVSELMYAGDPDDNLTLRLNLEDGDGDWSTLTGITAVNLYLDAKGFRIDNPGGRTRRTYIEGHGLEWTQGQKVRVWLTVAENNPPPNLQPTVVTVGETLYADASGITDADGLTTATFSYQWIQNDGNADTDTRSTGRTYTLENADRGKTIKVRVSFTDDEGSDETLTSAATAVVAAKPNNPATGLPAINGTAQVGETLEADTSAIGDADGLTDATFNYQWIVVDGSTDTDISGAMASTYTPVLSNVGKTIKVRVSFTDEAGYLEELTSLATQQVIGGTNHKATGAPVIAGTPKVEAPLAVDLSGIIDADGVPDDEQFSYQWSVNDGGGDIDIAGATGSNYSPVVSDVGKTLKVRVSFHDRLGYHENLTSAATAEVASVTNICDRTDRVRNKLLALTPSKDNCGSVSASELVEITELDLSGRVNALQVGDFDGLTGLTRLDLSDNLLYHLLNRDGSWPIDKYSPTSNLPDLFADLTSLEYLSLRNNSLLPRLPDDSFKNMANLRELDLRGFSRENGGIPYNGYQSGGGSGGRRYLGACWTNEQKARIHPEYPWNPREGSPGAFAPLTSLETYNYDADFNTDHISGYNYIPAPYAANNYTQPMPAPQNLQVSKSDGGYTLTWGAPPGASGITGYRVERRLNRDEGASESYRVVEVGTDDSDAPCNDNNASFSRTNYNRAGAVLRTTDSGQTSYTDNSRRLGGNPRVTQVVYYVFAISANGESMPGRAACTKVDGKWSCTSPSSG